MAATHLTEHTTEGDMVRAVQAMLRQSLHTALDSDMSYDTAPSMAISHTRRIFEDTVAAFLGSRRSFRRLPTELFVEVLSYLDITDLISASHVSRHWRSISLATPHLWSLLNSYDVKTDSLGVLAHLLDRSQGAPVTLDLIIDETNAQEISLCISRHLYHIKHLYVQLEEDLKPCLSQSLLLSLATQAPILRSFSLWDSYETLLASSTELRWFSGHAPLLHRLKLCAAPDLLRNNDGILHVQRLLISPVSPVRRIGPPPLAEMIDLFPQVDTLAVTIESSLSLLPVLPPETLRRLSGLQQLVITIHGRTISLDSMLQWLLQLTTPHITLSWRRPSELHNSVSEVITAMTSSLLPGGSLAIHYSEGLNLDFRGANGVERTFLEVPHELRPGAAAFAQIRSLSISELAWTQGDVLPPAPALTELRVFLLRPYSHVPRADDEHEGYGDASVFLLRERRALRCPALRRVALVVRCYNGYDPSDEPTVVAPLLVREFLQEQLVYDAPVLDSLAFIGFQLLQNPVDEVARLLAMAREVEVDPHRPSDLRPASDVLSWDWP